MFSTPRDPDDHSRKHDHASGEGSADSVGDEKPNDTPRGPTRREFLQLSSAAGFMASDPTLGGSLFGGAPVGGLASYILKPLSLRTREVLFMLHCYCAQQLGGTSLFLLLNRAVVTEASPHSELSATELAEAILNQVAEAADRRCADLSEIANLYGELEAREVFPEAQQFLETAHRFFNDYCEARSKECLPEVAALLQSLVFDPNAANRDERRPSSLLLYLWKYLPAEEQLALKRALQNNSLADLKSLLETSDGFLTPLGTLVRETEEYVCSPQYTRTLPDEIATPLNKAREVATTWKEHFRQSTGLDPDTANRLRYQLRHLAAYWKGVGERPNLPRLTKLPQVAAQRVIAQMAHSEFLEVKSLLPHVLSKIGATLPKMSALLRTESAAVPPPKVFKLAQEEIARSLDSFVETLARQLMERHFPSYVKSSNPKREAIERRLAIPSKQSAIAWPGGSNWGNDIY